MFFKRFIHLFSAIIFVSLFLEACSNKGCTDKNAVNFSVVADKDDGSCEFCNSAILQIGQDSVFVTDNNSSSSHYLEVVAKFIVTQKKLKYNYSSCGDDACSITYTVENLSDQDFDLNYDLHFSGNNMFFSIDNFITIAANETYDSIEIPASSISGNPCGSFFPGSLGVYTNSSIVYH